MSAERSAVGKFKLRFDWGWCLRVIHKNFEVTAHYLEINGLPVPEEIIYALLSPKSREIRDIIREMANLRLTHMVVDNICNIYLKSGAEECRLILKTCKETRPLGEIQIYRGNGSGLTPSANVYAVTDGLSSCNLTVTNWLGREAVAKNQLEQMNLPLNVFVDNHHKEICVSIAQLEQLLSLPKSRLQITGKMLLKLASIADQLTRPRIKKIVDEIIAKNASENLWMAVKDVEKRAHRNHTYEATCEKPTRVGNGYILCFGKTLYYLNATRQVFKVNCDEASIKNTAFRVVKLQQLPLNIEAVNDKFIEEEVQRRVQEIGEENTN